MSPGPAIRQAKCLVFLAAGVLLLVSSASGQELGPLNPADELAIVRVEVVFHQAASLKDLDMATSIFANDASLSAGGKTYTGKEQVRDFFTRFAGAYQPQNHWFAYTPTQKFKISIQGDRAGFYFECLYVDVTAPKLRIAAHTFAECDLIRLEEKWLVRNMKVGSIADF